MENTILYKRKKIKRPTNQERGWQNNNTSVNRPDSNLTKGITKIVDMINEKKRMQNPTEIID